MNPVYYYYEPRFTGRQPAEVVRFTSSAMTLAQVSGVLMCNVYGAHDAYCVIQGAGIQEAEGHATLQTLVKLTLTVWIKMT